MVRELSVRTGPRARKASLPARPAWGQGPGPRCDERGGACLLSGRGKTGGLMCRCCGHLVRAEPVAASGVRRGASTGDGSRSRGAPEAAPRPRTRKKKIVKKKRASEATLWQRRSTELEERMQSSIDPFIREHGSRSTDLHADDARDAAGSPSYEFPGDNGSTRIAASSRRKELEEQRRECERLEGEKRRLGAERRGGEMDSLRDEITQRGKFRVD
ncbi:hypothetical protein T484DRAFT_1749603 [Baffinella frigidus]|nr:hypothetical protein T484DRAFT_1749603 [Cryptophyta sp. CCMP2293]